MATPRHHVKSLFESFEHDHVVEGALDFKETFGLPNGTSLSFGQITALAGDFYGIPEIPIIKPFDKHDDRPPNHRQRFLDAHDTLARTDTPDHKTELEQILRVLDDEKKEIQAALSDGKTAKSAYEEIGNRNVEKCDTITGGRWIAGIPVSFGRVMKLAQSNYDHFLPNAKKAYLVGHEMALEKAGEAGRCNSPDQREKMLHVAYSLEAFAYHFLTDSFSAGHIRTPRIELATKVTPAKVGHLLCKYMHDEDNKFGLRVTNARGDKWVAYGDGVLFDEESANNRKYLLEAVRLSFDQVTTVYHNQESIVNFSIVTSLIPFVDEEAKNNAPMFQIKNGELLRRANLNNLQDSTTVRNWWGLTTLYKLRSYSPGNSVI